MVQQKHLGTLKGPQGDGVKSDHRVIDCQNTMQLMLYHVLSCYVISNHVIAASTCIILLRVITLLYYFRYSGHILSYHLAVLNMVRVSPACGWDSLLT